MSITSRFIGYLLPFQKQKTNNSHVPHLNVLMRSCGFLDCRISTYVGILEVSTLGIYLILKTFFEFDLHPKMYGWLPYISPSWLVIWELTKNPLSKKFIYIDRLVVRKMLSSLVHDIQNPHLNSNPMFFIFLGTISNDSAHHWRTGIII